MEKVERSVRGRVSLWKEPAGPWVDCRARARKLAEAARAGEERVVICARCETNVVVQHNRETVLCGECRGETIEEQGMPRKRAFEADRERF
ncbi:hypothetical protein C451_04701 [Halococcus thailandensis JCM 13552]|uniref:Uncharacterized protein n=1 Tax=Halococcus thailandensis JCM 13552 TaxID=1227457 RepID=M0NEQ7_9EURY|nr:hypothetical protein C451_04701 [Halococcus thailandensis JCM 13552]